MTTPDRPPPASALRRTVRAIALALGVVLLAIASTTATLIVALRYLGPDELDSLRQVFAPSPQPAPHEHPVLTIPRPVATLLVSALQPIPVPRINAVVTPTRPIPVPVARIRVDAQAFDVQPRTSPAPTREYRAPFIPHFGVVPRMPAFAQTEHLSAAWQAYRRELLAATLNATERDRLAHELQGERALVSSLQERIAHLETEALAATTAAAPPPALPDITPPQLPAPTQAAPAPPAPSAEGLATSVAAALDALRLALADADVADLRFAPEHTVVEDEVLSLVLEGSLSRVEHVFDDYSRELERSRVVIDAPGVTGLPAATASVLAEVLGEPDRSPSLEPGESVRFEGRTRTATLTIEGPAHVRVDIRHEGVAPGSMQVYRVDDSLPTGGVLMRQEPPSAP